MCGIAGIFQRNGAPVDPAVIRRMADTIRHRGPDDSGVWTDGAIGLGHRRLSIRDLSAAGRQPMADPTGQAVVSFNGEIYNYPQLRKQLEQDFGFVFRTQTDTELLPYGYLAWGEAFVDRLEGMFAFALWDRKTCRLLLARDGIGIKPLYYFANEDVVVFGSELKAVLASGLCPTSLAPEALHTFLAAGFPGPGSSLLRDVAQVRPGTVLTCTAKALSSHTFWKPVRQPVIHRLEDALDEFCPLLHDVVGSQLVSDVPLGVFQSGGIDSTLVSLAARRLEISPPLFTAAFDDPSHDETDLAILVARAAGLEHHVLRVSEDKDPMASFRAIAHHFDGQCADTGSYAFYRLCEEVRRHTTVVLSGDGGDEFFAGYNTYRASLMADRLRPWIPRWLLRGLGRSAYSLNAGNESRLPASALAARFALGLAAGRSRSHMHWRRLIPDFLLRSLYGPAMRPLLGSSPYSEYENCAGDECPERLDGWMLADQRFHLQSVLAKVDAMSMAHGLEIRVPLLDRRIMDFAGRCSTSLLLPRKGPAKFLLRKAAERLGAPAEVLHARKKGFNVPIASLLRNQLAPLGEFWFEAHPDVLAPHFNPEALRKLWREHRQTRSNHAFALWPLLLLAQWAGGGGAANAPSTGRLP